MDNSTLPVAFMLLAPAAIEHGANDGSKAGYNQSVNKIMPFKDQGKVNEYEYAKLDGEAWIKIFENYYTD